ncbi:MAG: RNA degradosome polyphosphate kinase, partial [Steroidobacter sp.]
HAELLNKIQREIEHRQRGESARIIAKMNALIDPQIIQALYQASMAGVKIDLIVRGICALRPGMPGISENIHVRSIVGRFLEHSRVYYFHNAGDTELYLASADWMERNFFRRVEIAFPVQSSRYKARILRDMETYLSDNTQAWILQADGNYLKAASDNQPQLTAQQEFLARINGTGK